MDRARMIREASEARRPPGPGPLVPANADETSWLAGFELNPIVLWRHDMNTPPVGRVHLDGRKDPFEWAPSTDAETRELLEP